MSSLLYLCVGEALARVLRRAGLGIEAAGVRLSCCMHADDAQVFLPGLGVLPRLLDVLGVFGRVTGQHLNVGKSQALLVGAPSAVPAPAGVGGVPVVQSASAVGCTFGAAAGVDGGSVAPKGGWEGRVRSSGGVLQACRRLPLSAFRPGGGGGVLRSVQAPFRG